MSLNKWIKTNEGNFAISVLEYEDGTSYVCCLSTEGRILKAPGTEGFQKILKIKHGKTEDEAFQQMFNWAKERYGNDIEVNKLNS